MQLVPVIDLKGGLVVHARGGERDAYAPIRSLLATNAEPVEIAAALLRLHPFTALYLADIDAIRRRGSNLRAIEAIHRAFPQVELWVDAGIADEKAFREWQARELGRAVIGTECGPEPRLIAALRSRRGGSQPLLSLDFGHGGPLGSGEVFADATVWPDDVIVMALARVGSGAGPDRETLAAVLARATTRRVFAAGGVRDATDVASLRRIGVAGALLASSLHDGSLASADLARTAGAAEIP